LPWALTFGQLLDVFRARQDFGAFSGGLEIAFPSLGPTELDLPLLLDPLGGTAIEEGNIVESEILQGPEQAGGKRRVCDRFTLAGNDHGAVLVDPGFLHEPFKFGLFGQEDLDLFARYIALGGNLLPGHQHRARYVARNLEQAFLPSDAAGIHRPRSSTFLLEALDVLAHIENHDPIQVLLQPFGIEQGPWKSDRKDGCGQKSEETKQGPCKGDSA